MDKTILEKFGIKAEDFKPKANNEKERIEILEDAFAELCEVVFAEEEQADD